MIFLFVVGFGFAIGGITTFYKTSAHWAGVAMLAAGLALMSLYVGTAIDPQPRPHQEIYNAE